MAYPVTDFLGIPLLPFDYGADGEPETWNIPANLGYQLIDTFASKAVSQAPTITQTVVQPAGTFFNFNSPIVYGAPAAIRFGAAANVWDSALTRAAAGSFTLDSNTIGDANGNLELANANPKTLQLNGAAPLNHILVGDGTHYVDSATLPAGLAFYQLVQTAGASVTQRNKLNFLSPLLATDNPTDGSTDISLTQGTVYAGSQAVSGGTIIANSTTAETFSIPATLTSADVFSWSLDSDPVTGNGIIVSIFAYSNKMVVQVSNPDNAPTTYPGFTVFYHINN